MKFLFFSQLHHFFSKLQLCVYQQNLTLDTINKDSLGKFGPHIVRLISEWTELFPYDFRDDRMMQHSRDLTQRIISIYPELRKEISAVMHALLTRVGFLSYTCISVYLFLSLSLICMIALSLSISLSLILSFSLSLSVSIIHTLM